MPLPYPKGIRQCGKVECRIAAGLFRQCGNTAIMVSFKGCELVRFYGIAPLLALNLPYPPSTDCACDGVLYCGSSGTRCVGQPCVQATGDASPPANLSAGG